MLATQATKLVSTRKVSNLNRDVQDVHNLHGEEDTSTPLMRPPLAYAAINAAPLVDQIKGSLHLPVIMHATDTRTATLVPKIAPIDESTYDRLPNIPFITNCCTICGRLAETVYNGMLKPSNWSTQLRGLLWAKAVEKCRPNISVIPVRLL